MKTNKENLKKLAPISLFGAAIEPGIRIEPAALYGPPPVDTSNVLMNILKIAIIPIILVIGLIIFLKAKKRKKNGNVEENTNEKEN